MSGVARDERITALCNDMFNALDRERVVQLEPQDGPTDPDFGVVIGHPGFDESSEPAWACKGCGALITDRNVAGKRLTRCMTCRSTQSAKASAAARAAIVAHHSATTTGQVVEPAPAPELTRSPLTPRERAHEMLQASLSLKGALTVDVIEAIGAACGLQNGDIRSIASDVIDEHEAARKAAEAQAKKDRASARAGS
jgi:hypothetical protein